MGHATKPTRHNRTLTVDFHDETTHIPPRLLLDSRVVDVTRSYKLIFITILPSSPSFSMAVVPTVGYTVRYEILTIACHFNFSITPPLSGKRRIRLLALPYYTPSYVMRRVHVHKGHRPSPLSLRNGGVCAGIISEDQLN